MCVSKHLESLESKPAEIQHLTALCPVSPACTLDAGQWSEFHGTKLCVYERQFCSNPWKYRENSTMMENFYYFNSQNNLPHFNSLKCWIKLQVKRNISFQYFWIKVKYFISGWLSTRSTRHPETSKHSVLLFNHIQFQHSHSNFSQMATKTKIFEIYLETRRKDD